MVLNYDPYSDYTNPPVYGGGYGEQAGGDQSGYKGMPVPPTNPNLVTMPISNPGMGALNPNMGDVRAIMGGNAGAAPNMGDLSGIMRGGGAPPLFSPNQRVLYRPAKDYGVAGDTVYPDTYQSAMSDLNGRLKAYDAAKEKMTGQSISTKASPSTNAINMDKYQKIADDWARQQREEEDKAAIVAQQQRNPASVGNPNVPGNYPKSARPQNTSPAFGGNETVPEHLYDDATGKTYISERSVPEWVKQAQEPYVTPDGKRWYEMPSTGTSGTYAPYFGLPLATAKPGYNPSIPVVMGAGGGGVFSGGGRHGGGGGSGGYS